MAEFPWILVIDFSGPETLCEQFFRQFRRTRHRMSALEWMASPSAAGTVELPWIHADEEDVRFSVYLPHFATQLREYLAVATHGDTAVPVVLFPGPLDTAPGEALATLLEELQKSTFDPTRRSQPLRELNQFFGQRRPSISASTPCCHEQQYAHRRILRTASKWRCDVTTFLATLCSLAVGAAWCPCL